MRGRNMQECVGPLPVHLGQAGTAFWGADLCLAEGAASLGSALRDPVSPQSGGSHFLAVRPLPPDELCGNLLSLDCERKM